jgi:hypothetical protein
MSSSSSSKGKTVEAMPSFHAARPRHKRKKTKPKSSSSSSSSSAAADMMMMGSDDDDYDDCDVNLDDIPDDDSDIEIPDGLDDDAREELYSKKRFEKTTTLLGDKGIFLSRGAEARWRNMDLYKGDTDTLANTAPDEPMYPNAIMPLVPIVLPDDEQIAQVSEMIVDDFDVDLVPIHFIYIEDAFPKYPPDMTKNELDRLKSIDKTLIPVDIKLITLAYMQRILADNLVVKSTELPPSTKPCMKPKAFAPLLWFVQKMQLIPYEDKVKQVHFEKLRDTAYACGSDMEISRLWDDAMALYCSAQRDIANLLWTTERKNYPKPPPAAAAKKATADHKAKKGKASI